MSRIEIIYGDITTFEVDAIVNAANKSLLGGGGVDGAIHQAAGPDLFRACQKLNGCEPGEAKITKGYNLKAKYVIHTVGPVWHGGEYREGEMLSKCYESSLNLAIQNHIETIAFPAISCGVYGFPIREAAEIALHTIVAFLKKNNSIKKVYLVCFEEDICGVFESILKTHHEKEYMPQGSAWSAQPDVEEKFKKIKEEQSKRLNSGFKEIREKTKKPDDPTKKGGFFK